MPKLTNDHLEAIRTRDARCAMRRVSDEDRRDLLHHIDQLETEIEDTAAAYQLAQRQLNACRQGRSTYEGTTR